MRSILVLRGGALGDFIVTLPALARLRETWPEARIELAGNATAAELARARGILNAVHAQHEARWSALYSSAPLPSTFAQWLGAFDLVINFWPDPDGELQRRFPLHDRQRFITHAAMPGRAPAAAHYLEVLRPLGIQPGEPFYRLRRIQTLAESPIDDVLVHPGSGSHRKNWPIENWLQLIPTLRGRVALVLGEAERALWTDTVVQRLQSCAEPPRLLVAAPLEELVARFARCRLFLGHDSGISHLAAAAGARCVLLFGPTEPALWAPPAPSVRVVRRHSDLASLSVADVQTAVAEALVDQR